MKRLLLVPLTTLPLLATLSCVKVPSAANERESGQSKLMDSTFAGANKCNPENHDRPFIIEWDATDMSSFEAYAANDMVMVHYEGCKLSIVDSCRDDSVKGSLGSYKAVEWTSGSLESIDIADQNELYAKLPLGEATLGGRVASGEKFKMEYYVAGTRTATRPKVYTEDLNKIEGCEDVTHFVYAYNLGAFALGSVQSLEASAGVSLYGFGGGGNKTTSRKADKKGGDLATCKSDSATEIAGCKVPVRLTLRKLTEGENPKAAQDVAADTDASLNAAAQIEAKMELSGKAQEYMTSAQEKYRAKDGKGCLAELDKFDKIEAKNQSTSPKSPYAQVRATCLMQAGKCDAGKQLLRKYSDHFMSAQMSPERIDGYVEAIGTQNCQGKLSDRDTLLQALQVLQNGAYTAKLKPKECTDAFATVKKLAPKVKPKDDEDTQVEHGPKNAYMTVATCLGRAGDCDQAWTVFKAEFPKQFVEGIKDEKQKETIIRSNFESSARKCQEKKEPT